MASFLLLGLLLASVLLGIVHLLLSAVFKDLKVRDVKWLLGPRDEPRELSPVGGRLERAYANFKETYIYFVIALFLLLMLSDFVEVSLWAPITYLLARLLYIPSYAFGWIIRSPVWGISLLGLIFCYVPLVHFFFVAMGQVLQQP